MERSNIAKIVAVIFILLTFLHLTYYFMNKYNFILFVAGFGVLYLSVPLVKKINGV